MSFTLYLCIFYSTSLTHPIPFLQILPVCPKHLRFYFPSTLSFLSPGKLLCILQDPDQSLNTELQPHHRFFLLWTVLRTCKGLNYIGISGWGPPSQSGLEGYLCDLVTYKLQEALLSPKHTQDAAGESETDQPQLNLWFGKGKEEQGKCTAVTGP